jgi:hypothetical protein
VPHDGLDGVVQACSLSGVWRLSHPVLHPGAQNAAAFA